MKILIQILDLSFLLTKRQLNILGKGKNKTVLFFNSILSEIIEIITFHSYLL